MYKISYEKCVCFIFLVILAILSCSGFRIDNLAMTDISKRNFHTSSYSSLTNSDILERIFNVEEDNTGAQQQQQSVETRTPYSSYRHRIRHHRQLRAPALRRFETNTPPPSGHIDALVFPPPGDADFLPTIQPNERFAQIPPTNLRHHQMHPFSIFPTTKPIITRSQRSSSPRKHQRNHKKQQHHYCQEQDITRKAYLADIVVRATAESMSARRRHNYSVRFKIIEQFKRTSSWPVDDHIQLTFNRDNTTGAATLACDLDVAATRPSNKLVKAVIRKARDYILFLNTYGPHNYTAFGAPELIKKRRIPTILRKVLQPNFKPKEPKIESLVLLTEKHSKRLKLECKTKGLPIPVITWMRNGKILHDSSRVRINHKKRKSTLVVKNATAEDWRAKYECVARGVNNRTDFKSHEFGDCRYKDKCVGNATTEDPGGKFDYGAREVNNRTDSKSYEFEDGKNCGPKHDKNFCQNGGTCFHEPTMDDYYCQCPPEFHGQRCEQKTPSQSSMYPQKAKNICKLGLSTKFYCNDTIDSYNK